MDTFALIAAERIRLADALEQLGSADWDRPSRCAGWSVHLVAAHLNAPWEVSLPSTAWAIVRSGGIHRGFDRIARAEAARLDPAACVAGLREHADSRFTPPGYGPEAPLTDVLVHGADMLQPLGRSVDAAPEAVGVSFDWIAGGRAKGFVPKGRLDGLTFEATDLDRSLGSGSAVVRGPALAICGAACGRTDCFDELSGDGAELLASRP